MTALEIVQEQIRNNQLPEGEIEPFPSFTFPGGYPMYYITKTGDVICPECCNKHKELVSDPSDTQWHIVAADINWENIDLNCEHCNSEIPAAYAERENKDLQDS